ncbi:MAG TPA: hypothetical protein VG826_05735 [Pirellulales bacterium]|nr:hypothetical protein [Pirellulales bacterium]
MAACLCRIVLLTGVVLASSGIVDARAVATWSYQKLFDESDIVVIATPTATSDTSEKSPGLDGFGQPVVGVETKFTVSAVLKGDKKTEAFVLHHYRDDGGLVPNGPCLVSFDPEKKRTYLLFLVREDDGRYAPTFGQVDPAVCGISVVERFAR